MDNKLVVVLTGEIGSGKTTLANSLEKDYNFVVLKTSEALSKIASSRFHKRKSEDKRQFLQRVGETLDRETQGRWVVEHYQSIINENSRIVVDSIRIHEQIEAFRQSYGHQNVLQIYLNVSDHVLESRHFITNKLKFDDLEAIHSYKEYKSNKTEAKVKLLAKDADLVIDAENAPVEDNVIRVASFLRLLPSVYTSNVDVLIGGQFGSEGKGQISAFLSPEYDCLVRVGGPNAGHKVFEASAPDTFHILPSGARRSRNSKIILGPGAVISLDILLREIKQFDIMPGRLIIDENCTIISEKDKESEAKLDKIGSTKQGVGAATANNLFHNRITESIDHKAKNRKELLQYLGSSHYEFEKLYSSNAKILLEGTQGSLLSLHHGIYPYVTSRDTTVSGCISEAGISPKRIRKIIMVTRTFPIRVQNPTNGTSGPFSRHDSNIEINYEDLATSSKIPIAEILQTELTSTTKKQRRLSKFNWALFREACEVNSPTDIALTFADYISIKNRGARRYDQLTEETTKFIDEIERCGGMPVSLIATNFNHRSIIDRRNWK